MHKIRLELRETPTLLESKLYTRVEISNQYNSLDFYTKKNDTFWSKICGSGFTVFLVVKARRRHASHFQVWYKINFFMYKFK
jgi:hypothetical protein